MNSHSKTALPQVNYAATIIQRSRDIGAFVALRVGKTDVADSWVAAMSHRREYANAVGEVAAALYAMAVRDQKGNLVRELTGKEKQDCQIASFQSGAVPVVAFVNHSMLLAHGRVAAGEERDVHVWGPNGLLGLQAVLLRVGQNTIAEDYSKPYGSLLGLIFRRPDSKLAEQQGFAMLEVNCVGDVSGQMRRPRPVLADDFLRLQMGIANQQAMCNSSTNYDCSIEQVLGFPDCDNYLADNLPGLVRYLYAVSHMRPV